MAMKVGREVGWALAGAGSSDLASWEVIWTGVGVSPHSHTGRLIVMQIDLAFVAQPLVAAAAGLVQPLVPDVDFRET